MLDSEQVTSQNQQIDSMTWKKLLSPRRIRTLGTGGLAPEGTKGRTEFERDHDRTIFSTPFRRLQDKAQVFPLEPIDAVRTRLTHTMEVSSVARGLASQVAGELLTKRKITRKQASDIVVIAETCGLLHDMGNPPFGHSGEDAIRDWFAARFAVGDPSLAEISSVDSQYRNDLLRFEGNAQTLRLVSKLQLLFDLDGLNLTAGTFSAACKYTSTSLEIRDKKENRHEVTKLGYFAAEADVIAKVRTETGTGERRNPIAFLVEASDDLVYAVVDIEDGIKKGVITWEFVKKMLLKRATPLVKKRCFDELKKKLKTVSFRQQERARGEAAAQFFRVLAINLGVEAVKEQFMIAYDSIMNGTYHGELLFDSKVAALYEALKTIGYQHVYCSGETLRLELLGRNVINGLMNLFWTADEKSPNKQFSGKAYALLSDNYRLIYDAACKKGDLPKAYLKALLITDHICGMTDSYALHLFQQLSYG
jgi:dGTPase